MAVFVGPRRTTLLLAWPFLMAGGVRAEGPAQDPFFTSWETIGAAQGLPSNKVLSVLADGPRVWAGTDQGVALLEGGKVRRVWGAAEGLTAPVAISLAADPRTGDLWIGTMGGLARLSAGRLDLFTQLDSGLANDVVYGVAVDGTDVWSATTGGISRYDTRTGSWDIFDNTNSIMHEPWCYAAAADSGAIYFAVWGGGLLVREKSAGRFRQHRDPDGEFELDMFRDDGLIHDITTSVAFSDGVLWGGTYFGLSRFDGRRWMSYTKDDSGLVGNFINFLRTKGDAVWIATDEGIGRFDSKVWHAWRTKKDGPGHEVVVTDAQGVKRSVLTETGLACNEVYSVDLDGRGDAWVATAAGLSHGFARAPAGKKGPDKRMKGGR
ncbi:MAG: regulator [Elusimicrobia bacterium]|nr:regulator [Elusimicrobiota bacterium]